MKNENPKREMTLEELKTELEAAQKAYEFIKEKYGKLEKEEADRKKAELALQKEKRMEEIKAKQDELDALCKSFIEDYGSITLESTHDNWWNPFWRHHFWF